MIEQRESRTSKLKIGHLASGFLISVQGRGTVKLSPLLHQFAVQAYESRSHLPLTLIAVDLNDCDYLDSTFLGCLVSLNRRCIRIKDQQFVVVADEVRRRALLEPNNLDRVLHIWDRLPEAVSEFIDLNYPSLMNSDLGIHVLDCHRRLAELDGPNREAFSSITARLDAELSDQLLVRAD